MAKKPVTLHYRLGNEREFLKKVLSTNEKVTIRRTNYSMKIETDRRNYLFANGGTASKRSFIAYNKIVSDIKKDR